MEEEGSLEKVLNLIVERLPLLVLFILAGIVIATQSSAQAFSEYNPPTEPVSAQDESFSWVPSTPTPTPIPPTPTNTPTPTPTATPTPIPPPANPADDSVWEKLADCESHKNWGANTGNGYFGGLQFSQGAWASVGGSGSPHEASREEQISRGKMLQERRGWGPWGACSKALGLN